MSIEKITKVTAGVTMPTALKLLRNQWKLGYFSKGSYAEYLELIGGDSATTRLGKDKALSLIQKLRNGERLPELNKNG